MTRIIVVALSVVFTSGLLFVNLYTSIVDATNWGAAIPGSIVVSRQYFSAANPGDFFRIASPINQLLALITVIICWKSGQVRYIAIAALLLAVSADLLTFGYFYPRNEVIFSAPLESNTEAIRQAVNEWSSMNWLRSGIVCLNSFFAMCALVIIAKRSAI